MGEIRVYEKPEDVSYDYLCALLDEIHGNEAIDYSTSGMNGTLFEEKLAGGKAFIAYYDDRIVGLVAMCADELNSWYHTGKAARIRFMGVLKEYQRHHIGRLLLSESVYWALNNGFDAVYFTTSEKNEKAIAFYKSMGFTYVDYKKYKGEDHCSPLGIKWKENAPKSQLYLYLKYLRQKKKAHDKLKKEMC